MYRKLKFKSGDEVLAEVERLADGYEMLGKWSLGQCCRHLTVTMEFSRKGFPFKTPWVIHGLLGPIIKRGLFWSGSMPKVSAPAMLVPGPHGADDDAVYKFRREWDTFEAWEKPMAISPLFGKLTKDEWRRVHLIHAQRHLGFLLPGKSS
jgi:hypothetical protein